MKPLKFARTRRPFSAFRDVHGVPHITAATQHDALYGLGFLHAVDRGSQVLFARSIAAGRATEQLGEGPELFESDRLFRKAFLTHRLREETKTLKPETLAQLTAYCDGVNDGLTEGGRTWPMWAVGFVPEPWDVHSVLLIGVLLAYGGLAISQTLGERLLLEMIHIGINEKGLKELFQPRLDNVDFDLLRRVKLTSQLSDEALDLLGDLPMLAGSNAWAVGPSRSATGRALFAADPHLEVNRLPAIWYEAVLRWGDDEYVMGASLPGCPLFGVARTKRLAWGVTYLRGDSVDHFIEDCRQGGATGWQYRRGDDTWHDFRLRVEKLKLKTGGEEKLRVYENDQGTLDGDPNELGAGLLLSTRWAGDELGAGEAISAWLDMIDAPDVRRGMEIAKYCWQPTLCWVFADRDGHIGQQAAGRLPIRGGGHSGLTPIPAWDESNHWQGWISPHDLPSKYDPPEGYIASANEEQPLLNGAMIVTQIAADYRYRRICERLDELPQATLDDMQSLQYDVVSLQARDLLKIILPCLAEGPIKERLSQWKCDYPPQSYEATLFLRLYRQILLEIFGHETGIGRRRMAYIATRGGYSIMVLTAVDRLLSREESYWWHGKDKAELIRAAAGRLRDAGEAPWSKVNSFRFTDRFFGGHRVGRLLGFNSRPYPMPGNFATPFQGQLVMIAKRASTFSPSYHFVADMGLDEASTNLPGGPSENRFSGWYHTDVRRWLTGEYKQLKLL